MSHDSLNEQLEQLVANLVLIGPSDKMGLQDLAEGFHALYSFARTSGHTDIADLADQVSQNLAACADLPKDKAAEGLGDINELTMALQNLLLEGQIPKTPLTRRPIPTTRPTPMEKPEPPTPVTEPDIEEFHHPGELPDFVDHATFADFLARQGDVLQDLEQLVMDLEREPDTAKLDELKRIIHNYKGEASLLGLDEVKRLCHVMEDALGTVTVQSLADVLLQAKDWMHRAFDAYACKGPDPGPAAGLITMLRNLRDQGADAPTQSTKIHISEAVLASTEGRKRCAQFISTAPALLETLHEKLLVLEARKGDEQLAELVDQIFHDLVKLSGRAAQSAFMSLCLGAETLMEKFQDRRIAVSSEVLDLLYDISDALRARIDQIENALSTGQALPDAHGLAGLEQRTADMTRELEERELVPDPVDPEMKLGEILVASREVAAKDVEQALAEQKNQNRTHELGQILVEDQKATERTVQRALAKQKVARDGRAASYSEVIKVDASRLDHLINTIGEMVITESKLCQIVEATLRTDPDVARLCTHLDKLTHEMHELGTSLRMVPVRPTFLRMSRLVRDLSRRTGKALDFVMTGAETEIDKAMVDTLGDPLMHLIRNAVDHGIEDDATARQAAGKPAKGRIELRAFHKGGNIFLEIADDGRGLDLEAIVAQARRKGLIGERETWDERDMRGLIFHPGLSTADEVTDLSGRGVGMDVVKEKIDALQGHIDITSRKGRGSTFTIRLPLTLSIIDGMVVRCGPVRYIIPTLAINRCLKPGKEDVHTVFGRGKLVRVEDRDIPCYRLADLLDSGQSDASDTGQPVVVVLEDDGRLLGLEVEHLEGKQQIVIKTLGKAMQNIPGISGGAILPDGTVGLVINVTGMMNMTRSLRHSFGSESGTDAT